MRTVYIQFRGRVVFDKTFLHDAENRTAVKRIVVFCDIEPPMGFAVTAAISRWLGRLLLGAATLPNQPGNPVGGIDKAFRCVQEVQLPGKRIKTRSRVVCCALKWLLFGRLLPAWLLA